MAEILKGYVILYQYFDSQEIKLLDQIEQLQSRAIYRDERKLSIEETEELLRLKIRLDFCRKIERELLQLFMNL